VIRAMITPAARGSPAGTTWPLYLVSDGGPTIADNITQTYLIDVADASLGAGNYVVSPANTTIGTIVHTAVAGTTAGTFDEIWLWAQNNHTSDVIVTVEFGSHDHADNIIVTIPSKGGLVPVVPGFILQNEQDVNVFAGTTAVIMIHGFVNAITD
jgi:hypothetical protein